MYLMAITIATRPALLHNEGYITACSLTRMATGKTTNHGGLRVLKYHGYTTGPAPQGCINGCVTTIKSTSSTSSASDPAPP